MQNLESRVVGPEEIGRKFFTGFHLKIIGVFLMVFDHTYQMFYAYGAPEWFNWLGRPVAPIFLFLCAEGFHHTGNKKRYMSLLFSGFLFMNVVSTFLTAKMRLEDVALINNIFGTLFVSTLYMLLSDIFRKGVKEKRAGRVFLSLLGMLLPVGVGISLIAAEGIPIWLRVALLRYIPNPVTVEGGFALTFLGVWFHLCGPSRFLQNLAVLALGILSFTSGGGAQWLMIFSIIPISLYNGKRGGGGKYFFYIFYPAHIYALYITAWLSSQR
ncbi:MAG: conjugal transfer protein TraX [Synergistaceae bacterium]|jgi:hypothetical protein|nr:conjugal transfer protein TraX [Synergistaceae bacterium]